jgi:hypothetical protein
MVKPKPNPKKSEYLLSFLRLTPATFMSESSSAPPSRNRKPERKYVEKNHEKIPKKDPAISEENALSPEIFMALAQITENAISIATGKRLIRFIAQAPILSPF